MLSKILFLFSLSFIKTIYFNFHYLPFKQAIKLPIILRHVRFKSLKGKVIIDSDHIYTNMIKFGFKSANYWLYDIGFKTRNNDFKNKFYFT